MTVFTHILSAVLGIIVGMLIMSLCAVALKLKQVEEADEVKCTAEGPTRHATDRGMQPIFTFKLSCGHTSSNWSGKPPMYCPECGKKVSNG